MKNIKKIFATLFIVINVVSCRIFAESAFLEGDEALNKKPSILDGLDSSIIMANWYKIVLIIVALLCIVGFIVGNVIWAKNRRNKK